MYCLIIFFRIFLDQVKPNATAAEIRKAYLKQSKIHHPDKQ